MPTPAVLQPTGLTSPVPVQLQFDQLTPLGVLVASYNPLSDLADAADLCLRTGLDPDLLNAAMILQAERKMYSAVIVDMRDSHCEFVQSLADHQGRDEDNEDKDDEKTNRDAFQNLTTKFEATEWDQFSLRILAREK